MSKIKLYKKSIFLIFLLFRWIIADAQTGIFFQAIARDNNTNPAKERKIYIQSNIIASSPSGTKVLIEEHQTNTDAYGIFSIMIGNGIRVGGTVTGLNTIDWSKGPYYLNLKIAITPVGVGGSWDYSKEWLDLGTTIFGTVPFALYSASTAKIDEKLDAADTSKMLVPYAKSKVVQTLSSSIDSKLATKDTAAMLTYYAKIANIDSALRTKLDISDTIKYSTINYTDSILRNKINITDSIKYAKLIYTDSALLTKLNIFDTSVFTKKLEVQTALQSKLNVTDTIKYTKLTYTDSALLTKLSITSLTSLNTVGTISAGVWSATTIDIAHGGTGLSTAGSSGQILTSTESGNLTWTNFTTLTGAHYLGESFGGGIVFYVYDNGKHGLIIAPEDQSTGINASTFTSSNCCTTTNAFRDGVNAGMSNTERIIISQGSGSYAASLAANYKGGGYGDWYLPSIAEMKLIILNSQYIMGTFINSVDKFKIYWSSNENPSNNKQYWSNYLILDSGNYIAKYSNPSIRVRAIRAF